MGILLWLGTILITLVIWLNSVNSFWQYIFFLRVPILMGLLLITVPLIATRLLRAMLRNLFVLRGQQQLAFVIISTVMAGTSVVLVANIILHNAPARFSIPAWFTIAEFWQYVLGIFLALPVCITAVVLSKEQPDKIGDKNRWIGVLKGGIASLGLLLAISFTQRGLASNDGLKQQLLKAISFLTKQETAGYINLKTNELASEHLVAFASFLTGIVVYGLVGLYFKPKQKQLKAEAPALLYAMFIATMLTLLFGGITFFFDFYRIPSLILFLAFSAVSYVLFNVDHFFELSPLQNKKFDSELRNFGAVLEKRLQHQSAEKTLVVVCASGGGIQAAGWTVQVLMGLQKLLGKSGESFARSIGLISSVSGGSVGAMYYLDRFNLEKGIPETNDFKHIFSSATRDSLDAIGWGLAYPDLWRIIGLPFLAPPKCDRGKAVEIDWRGEMKNPQSITSLDTWRDRVLDGQIPIPVFNATLVEDGRRFLISPMTFGRSDEEKFIDFNTLYEGYDLNVVTAARLSASFPYISPISRSNINQKGKKYHIADGGYFDNSGVVTVVEWLNKLLSSNQNPNITRVMLLQINAFPKSLAGFEDADKQGWFLELIGPLLTLYKVRDSTQIARNIKEIELLQQRWQERIKIEYFPVFFPSFSPKGQLEERLSAKVRRPESHTYFFNNGKYAPPLSWKLTDVEKKMIEHAWEMIANEPDGVIEKIKNKWVEWKM
jgi:hypothetical protein